MEPLTKDTERENARVIIGMPNLKGKYSPIKFLAARNQDMSDIDSNLGPTERKWVWVKLGKLNVIGKKSL